MGTVKLSKNDQILNKIDKKKKRGVGNLRAEVSRLSELQEKQDD